jgi:hypothetical protein
VAEGLPVREAFADYVAIHRRDIPAWGIAEHWDGAHRLDARGNNDVVHTGHHRLRGEVDRLLR